jgi:hypothetical protein
MGVGVMGIKKEGSLKKLITNLRNMEGKTLIGTCGDCGHGKITKCSAEGWVECTHPKRLTLMEANDGCIHWKEKTE